MQSTPDFLLNREDDSEDQVSYEDALKLLKTSCDSMKSLDAEIDEKERELKAVKEVRRKISQETIPELLLTHGLSRIKLASGEEVTVKADVSVTISDHYKFVSWLEQRDEADIVKIQMAFDKMPTEKLETLYEWLSAQEYEYDSKRDVHPQTRKKYFRELLGVGKDDQEEGIAEGRYMRKEDIEAFAKVFTYYQTKIK